MLQWLEKGFKELEVKSAAWSATVAEHFQVNQAKESEVHVHHDHHHTPDTRHPPLLLQHGPWWVRLFSEGPLEAHE